MNVLVSHIKHKKLLHVILKNIVLEFQILHVQLMPTVIKATARTKNVFAYMAMPTKRTVLSLDVSITTTFLCNFSLNHLSKRICLSLQMLI